MRLRGGWWGMGRRWILIHVLGEGWPAEYESKMCTVCRRRRRRMT